MAKSRLQDGTEPVVFVPEVAKQHDLSLLGYVGAIAFGVLVGARGSLWLDNKNRKLFDCFNEDEFLGKYFKYAFRMWIWKRGLCYVSSQAHMIKEVLDTNPR